MSSPYGGGSTSSLSKPKRKSNIAGSGPTTSSSAVIAAHQTRATPGRRPRRNIYEDQERELTDEQRAEIKEAFDLFDADKDGALDCASRPFDRP